MAKKEVAFRCYNCKLINRIVIEVSNLLTRFKTNIEGTEQLVEYCENCQKENIITVPDTWDVTPAVLGERQIVFADDDEVLEGKEPA